MSNKKVSTAMLISEMDQNLKRMLKLIEEDGDSFAKKAEMYYEKRPELINLLDEFQRMYRSLSERYDHSTGETKKNIGLDIQSQSSCMSELCSELPSGSASPDLRPARRRSAHRAPGFDYFLGAGGNLELGYREGDDMSALDSGSESDGYYAANDDENVLRRKIYHLEVELRNAREKLRLHQEDNSECSPTGSGNGNVEAVHPTLYEEEFRDIKEKLKLSEEEVCKLSTKLSAYEVMDVESLEVPELEDGNGSSMEEKVVALEKKFRMVKASLGAEMEILQKKVTEKNEEVEELTQNLAAITRNHHMVVAEKAKLGAKIEKLTAEMTSKDDKIDAMCQELDQLHMENAKMDEELRSRERELETKIEEQQEIILEGAEEKREAIRQLCFSLEHYRTGYLRLRDVVVNPKKNPVMAT